MTDHFRYDLLTQQALRGVVPPCSRKAASGRACPGDHHFYISFDTTAEGVRMSSGCACNTRADDRHPAAPVLGSRRTRAPLRGRAIVRRHSGGLWIPFEAVTGFFGPSVQFGLQFEEVVEGEDRSRPQSQTVQESGQEEARRPPVPAAVAPAVAATPAPAETDKPAKPVSGTVVSIDRFRRGMARSSSSGASAYSRAWRPGNSPKGPPKPAKGFA